MVPLRHQPCRVMVILALFLCHAAVTTSSIIESQYANAPRIDFNDMPKHFPQLQNKRDDNSSSPFPSPPPSTTFAPSEEPKPSQPYSPITDPDFYSDLIAPSQVPEPNSASSSPNSSPNSSNYEQVSLVAPSQKSSPKSTSDFIPSTSLSPNDRPTLTVSPADREPLASPTERSIDNTQASLGPDILSALKSAFPGAFTSLTSMYFCLGFVHLSC